MKLRIAANFTLPPEAVTQTFAILGIRGSGKTNTGVVLTEELLGAKQQVVVIDPVDVWWGLKSSSDGRQPGYALPVIGGDHADIPLDGAAGQVLADKEMQMRTHKKLAPVHPGEILAGELREIRLSMNGFAKAIHVPPNRITAIIKGERGITGETALRFARYFGTSPEMWLDLQSHYDLEMARDRFEAAVNKQIEPRQAA